MVVIVSCTHPDKVVLHRGTRILHHAAKFPAVVQDEEVDVELLRRSRERSFEVTPRLCQVRLEAVDVSRIVARRLTTVTLLSPSGTSRQPGKLRS